jgi:hypothetical protein
MTFDGCQRTGGARTVATMDTRTLGYIGLGVLVGIVVATLIGLPPLIWITAAIVALVAIVAVAMAQSTGASDAARMLARESVEDRQPAPEAAKPAPTRYSDVEMELVRAADDDSGTPAVWLHRRGGRRVHRYAVTGGWVVERVSTKDPDNPRKRVIGDSLTFATEADAIAAADELAQGQAPASPFPERPALTVAEA